MPGVNYRHIVRSKLVEVLASDFAEANEARSLFYGVPPLNISFTYPSRNFIHAFIDPLEFDASTAAIELPGLALYTSEAVDLKTVKNMAFSGFVAGHLDFYLRYRALRDRATASNAITERNATFEPEVLADCVEDSALMVLTSQYARTTFREADFNMTDYKANRDAIEFLGDGFLQRVSLTLGFSVLVR